MLEELEEVLIMSDVGTDTSLKIIDNLRQRIKKENIKEEQEVREALKEEIQQILEQTDSNLKLDTTPSVILVVGVNGVGKTTSIGKLANLYQKNSKRVLLAAADTFRAGAVEQLEIWAKRSNTKICVGKNMQDPSSVIYDATKQFLAEDYDVLICDTAGRLHNNKNLMDELQKMKKILDKNLPDVEKETVIVLDATTGQNGMSQVKSFFEKANVDSIILTKLDSTAKGGVVFNIVENMNIPIKYVGTGEGIDDIEIFDAKEFVEAII